MNIFLVLICILLSYLVGAIPFGWMIVWNVKKIDIRYHASGRMGMSNVMRTAGWRWGILSGALDIIKGIITVWIPRWILPAPMDWLVALCALLSVIGHIYSIYIIEKRRDGYWHFRGGAGGLTSLGAAIGLWWPVMFIIVLPVLFIYLFVGYASITTFSINVFSALTFAVCAWIGDISWWYVISSLIALTLVAWSLRPNWKRLRRGEERPGGLKKIRADIKRKKNR